MAVPPNGWDAGLLFEETNGTLLCSDLFHQNGDVEPLTESDVVERSRSTVQVPVRDPGELRAIHAANGQYLATVGRPQAQNIGRVAWLELCRGW
jgi:hypothetical protein